MGDRDQRVKLATRIAERDGGWGWACRYCGCPLVPLDQCTTVTFVVTPRTTVGGGCGCGAGIADPETGDRTCGGCEYSVSRVRHSSVVPGEFADRRAPQIEHLVPLARGGTDVFENVGLSCGPCNYAKGTMTEDEHRAQALL